MTWLTADVFPATATSGTDTTSPLGEVYPFSRAPVLIADSTTIKLQKMMTGTPARVIKLDHLGAVVSDSDIPKERPPPYAAMTEVRPAFNKVQVCAPKFKSFKRRKMLKVQGDVRVVTSDGWVVAVVVQHAMSKATRSKSMGKLLETTMSKGLQRHVAVSGSFLHGIVAGKIANSDTQLYGCSKPKPSDCRHPEKRKLASNEGVDHVCWWEQL